MSEMVERVAQAMALTQDGDTWDVKSENGDGYGYVGKTEYRVMARAAIQAMREPTQPMREVVWDLLEKNAHVGNLRPGKIRGNGAPDAIMSKMVDAALTGPGCLATSELPARLRQV